jgi:hypothetical protein
MAALNNVTTQSTYADATTLRCPAAKRFILHVRNAAAYWRNLRPAVQGIPVAGDGDSYAPDTTGQLVLPDGTVIPQFLAIAAPTSAKRYAAWGSSAVFYNTSQFSLPTIVVHGLAIDGARVAPSQIFLQQGPNVPINSFSMLGYGNADTNQFLVSGVCPVSVVNGFVPFDWFVII